MTQKVVQFLSPVLIEKDNSRKDIKAGFWDRLHTHVEAKTFAARNVRINAAPFYGEAGVGVAPALKHLRVGRVREAAEWPDTIDASKQAIKPLHLGAGLNLFEAGYVVPFGTQNKIAFMGPLRGIVSIRALEVWVGLMLDLAPHGQRIELVPEVDSTVMDKLRDAEGVTKLMVRVPRGVELELADGNETSPEQALRAASETSDDELAISVMLSAGNSRASTGVRKRLQNAAERLARAVGPDKIEVSMLTEVGDNEFRVGHHDLLRDVMTATAEFEVADNTQLSVDDILQGINDAIEEFRSRT